MRDRLLDRALTVRSVQESARVVGSRASKRREALNPMVKSTLSIAIAIVALLIVGSCGYGPFNSLAERDQQRFERCWRSSLRFRANACGASDRGGSAFDPAGLTSENCEDTAKHLYVDQGSEDARRQWLLEGECPARLVGDAR